jgi:hypothetical protein
MYLPTLLNPGMSWGVVNAHKHQSRSPGLSLGRYIVNISNIHRFPNAILFDEVSMEYHRAVKGDSWLFFFSFFLDS